MKKLIFIGAMALISMAACQNENNEVLSAKTEDLSKVAFKGRVLTESKSELAQQAINIVNNGALGKRVGSVYCSDTYNGHHYALVIVSGDNQPNTYWYVIDGKTAYQITYEDVSFNACQALGL